MQCPTYVSIQAESDSYGHAFYFSEGNLDGDQVIPAAELTSGSNRKRVPKGNIDVVCVTGEKRDGMTLSNGHTYFCRLGRDADSLYTFVQSRYVTEDAALFSGILLKQFAHVTLEMSDERKGDSYPYYVVIKGDYAGIDVYNNRAVKSAFMYRPQLDGNNFCEFNLNRQGDDSLSLELHMKDDGSLYDTIPLGQLIAQTGYSWQTDILSDIRLVIDYARATVSITVNGWDEVISFSFTI